MIWEVSSTEMSLRRGKCRFVMLAEEIYAECTEKHGKTGDFKSPAYLHKKSIELA